VHDIETVIHEYLLLNKVCLVGPKDVNVQPGDTGSNGLGSPEPPSLQP
jgi:hypothetical protein